MYCQPFDEKLTYHDYYVLPFFCRKLFVLFRGNGHIKWQIITYVWYPALAQNVRVITGLFRTWALGLITEDRGPTIYFFDP